MAYIYLKYQRDSILVSSIVLIISSIGPVGLNIYFLIISKQNLIGSKYLYILASDDVNIQKA